VSVSTVGSTGTTDPPSSGGSGTAQTTNADLAWWLHYATTNAASLPKLIYDYLTGFAASVGDQFDNITSTLGTIGGNVITLLNRLSASLVSKLNAASDAVIEWLNNPPWATPTHVEDAKDDLTALIESLVFDNRPPQDVIPIPGEGWAMTDTVAGTGAYVWNVPADRYIWHSTGYASYRNPQVYGGVNYFMHRGWWCPLNFDLVGNYHTFVGTAHEFYEPGCRLPGLLMYCDPDVEWTLQAWTWTAPS
jgi:hypothetical protein